MNQELPLGQRLALAQQRGDVDEAISLAKVLLEKRPDNVDRVKMAARMLAELQRHEEAFSYWQSIADTDPSDMESRCHLVRHHVAKQADLSSEISEALKVDYREVMDVFATRGLREFAGQSHAKIQEIIRDTIVRPIVDPEPDPDARVFAICGVSFCGSTLLDRILGSLPETRSIGESHWLTKSYIDKVAAPIDFTREFSRGIPQCSHCGWDCEYLTPDFRGQLAADRTNWYFKIARRLSAKNLITADKNLRKLVEIDPLLRINALVLFKSPKQQWYSQLTKLPQGKGDAFYEEKLTAYIETWTKSYRAFLDEFEPKGKIAYVNFDRFTRDPASIFHAVAEKLGLPDDDSVLKNARPGHAIGGNSRAMRRIRDDDYGVDIMPLAEVDLPQSHVDTLDAAEAMQELFGRMMEKCVSNSV